MTRAAVLTPTTDTAGGAGGFPEDLFTIPGDPAAVSESARRYDTFAAAAAAERSGIASRTLTSWVGSEGDLYRARLAEYPPMLDDATAAFGSVARSLQAFADTMEAQQKTMRALRDEAWTIWQQMQAAAAAQTSAAGALTRARQDAATLPVTGVDTAATAAAAERVGQASAALEAANSALAGLRSAWEDCCRRAQEIHRVMSTAARSASSTITGLQHPPAAPPPSAGGAGALGMAAPITGGLGTLLLGGAAPRGAAGRLTAPSGSPDTDPPSIGPATPLAPPPPGFAALAVDKVVGKLTTGSEWVKALNILPNKDVPEWASYLMPGASFWATGAGLASDYDEFRQMLRPMMGSGPTGSGATAVNLERLRLDAFIARNGPRLSRAATRLGDSVDALAWVASQPTMRIWAAAGAGGMPPASQLLDDARPLVKRTGSALASKVDAGRTALTGVIDDLARKPINPAWGKVGKVAGHAGTGLSAVTGAMEQWQKDASNPAISGADRAARMGVRGGLVAGGGWAGATAGAAVGATVGSVVPVLGTAVGGAVGGIVGGMGGSIAGDGLADAVMDRWDEVTPW